jgi:hypothetical protein
MGNADITLVTIASKLVGVGIFPIFLGLVTFRCKYALQAWNHAYCVPFACQFDPPIPSPAAYDITPCFNCACHVVPMLMPVMCL